MFIRTKNRIYQVESTLRDNGFIKGYNVGEMAFIRKDQVINQSENLEELCDEFVYVRNKPSLEKPLTSLIRDISIIDKVRKKSNTTVYGCIWTDWGLKYVAKMDSEGKLVLI